MNARRGAAARPFPSFGRRATACAPARPGQSNRLSDDLRLFALTFAGGFLFMSVYLA